MLIRYVKKERRTEVTDWRTKEGIVSSMVGLWEITGSRTSLESLGKIGCKVHPQLHKLSSFE